MTEQSQPVLLVLSGPSGVGKTTVAHRLLEANSNLQRMVTCTTRAPREGEAELLGQLLPRGWTVGAGGVGRGAQPGV